MSNAFNPARRQFFRGDIAARRLPLRPPWSVTESAFVTGCTRCNACAEACPEKIIERDGGGFPELNFQRGECTFCGDCVGACPAPVFGATDDSPWNLRARIGGACVAPRQVMCRSCGEQCEVEAIHFMPQVGAVPVPTIDADACTGCGACVAVCPTQAISIYLPGAGG